MKGVKIHETERAGTHANACLAPGQDQASSNKKKPGQGLSLGIRFRIQGQDQQSSSISSQEHLVMFMRAATEHCAIAHLPSSWARAGAYDTTGKVGEPWWLGRKEGRNRRHGKSCFPFPRIGWANDQRGAYPALTVKRITSRRLSSHPPMPLRASTGHRQHSIPTFQQPRNQGRPHNPCHQVTTIDTTTRTTVHPHTAVGKTIQIWPRAYITTG